MVLVHAWRRWADREVDLFATRERVAVGALAGAAGVSGLLWPAVCAVVTGVPDGYTRTQAAWRGRDDVVPLVPWYDVAVWLLGGWGVPVLVAVLVLGVLVVRSASLRRLGPELQGWTAAYLGYLLVVVEPGTSLVRFGLLAFPVAGALAGRALRSARPGASLGVVLVAGVLTQAAWVALLWRLVPPSGWPP